MNQHGVNMCCLLIWYNLMVYGGVVCICVVCVCGLWVCVCVCWWCLLYMVCVSVVFCVLVVVA